MKVKVDGREVRVEKSKEGYTLDVRAAMKDPGDLMDRSYLTADGGRTFVETQQVLQMTASPAGSVSARGGLTPTEPVKEKALVDFLRRALHDSGVYSYTVLGVSDPRGLTHVWTFEVDPEPGVFVTFEETGDVYRVLRKRIPRDSKPQTIPESELHVEFLGKGIKATYTVKST
jgi:hypothetical protein